MDYDIFGDVHGHADKLVGLLSKMGYARSRGAWRHPSRMAVICGDLVDRGPGQLECVRIARGMRDAGTGLTIMGNHELNAIGWATPSAREPGDFLRQRRGEKGRKNLVHHKEFLDQVGAGSATHKELVDWFMTLPLWLDLPEIRVVHACWHPRAIEVATARLGASGLLRPELLQEAIDELSERTAEGEMSLFEAVELICKGVEIELPLGRTYVDQVGFERARVRSRWWDASAVSFKQCAMLEESEKAGLPDDDVPPSCLVAPPTDKPLFFGHYWMTGTPAPLGPKVACVDYSAAKKGPLVAYRYSGEDELSAANFVAFG